jgi:hypothetical protein
VALVLTPAPTAVRLVRSSPEAREAVTIPETLTNLTRPGLSIP